MRGKGFTACAPGARCKKKSLTASTLSDYSDRAD